MNKNMDLVNSITANSNNKNETMENQKGDDCKDSNDGGKAVATSASASAGKENAKIPDYLKAIGMDPRKFWPKKYRFTREKPPGQYNPLSIAQRNFYENNGYIVIDDAIAAKLLGSIKTEFNQSSYVNEFLMDKLVAKNNKLLQYVKCFCDERIMLMTSNLIESFQSSKEAVESIIDNKQIQRQQLFRDWIYLPFRPMDKVVCALIAVEPIEQTFLVVPGTHRIGQCNISSTLENITAAYESSHDKSNEAIAKEIFECAPEKLSSLVEKSRKGPKYISLKPGQTLFYHPGLIHGFSDDLVNYNKRQLAAVAYYAAADCEYVDLRKSIDLLSNQPVPITLGHFKDKNPSDYSSWIDKPKLLRDIKASL